MRNADAALSRRVTKLHLALANPDEPGALGPLRAYRQGVRTFMAGERIDMSAMARQLDINRATLYRWVGSRDQFLVEMIWQLSRTSLDRIEREAVSSGPDRIITVAIEFTGEVIENPGMKYWLASEGEAAMSLLTRSSAGYQQRLIGWMEDAIDRQVAAGQMVLPQGVGSYDLAYVIERVMAGYVYLDLITGEKPDADRAEPLLRMLLASAAPGPVRSG